MGIYQPYSQREFKILCRATSWIDNLRGEGSSKRDIDKRSKDCKSREGPKEGDKGKSRSSEIRSSSRKTRRRGSKTWRVTSGTR